MCKTEAYICALGSHNVFWPRAMTSYQSALTQNPALDIAEILTSLKIYSPPTCVSKLAFSISNQMPEWYPGDHIQTASTILYSPTNESMSDFLKIIIYKVANGHRFHNQNQWDKVMQIIGPAIVRLQIDLKRPRHENTIIRAFFDEVFHYEILWATLHVSQRQSDALERPLHIIKWLLESGQDPNLREITPLRQAIEVGHLELVQVLLHFHGRFSILEAQDEGESAIESALSAPRPDAIKLRLLKILYQHYDSISLEKVLCATIQLRDKEFIHQLLYQDACLTTGHHHVSDFDHVERVASVTTNKEIEGDFAQLSPNNFPIKTLLVDIVTTCVFVAAAIAGDCETIRRLHEIQPVGGQYSRQGFTPLQAAVRHGKRSTCELLFELYPGPSPSLLYIAAFGAHEDVLRWLVGHPAHINAPITEQESSAVLKLCPHSDIRPGSSILKTGSEWLSSILGNYIGSDWESLSNCLAILIGAGAKLVKGNIADFASYGLEKALLSALEVGGSPDDSHYLGFTAIQRILGSYSHLRIKGESRLGIVQALLQAGACLKAGDIVAAIRTKDQYLLDLLLRYGGTLKDKDKRGVSCLEAAILARYSASNEDTIFFQQVFEVLEAQEDDIDAGPFCAAMVIGDWDLVSRLFTRGHDKAGCHLVEGTAIGLAARYGRFDVLEKLLSRFGHCANFYSAFVPLEFSSGAIIGPLRDDLDFWRGRSLFDRRVKASPLALTTLTDNDMGFRELLQKGLRIDKVTLTAIVTFCHKNGYQYLKLLRSYRPEFDTRHLSHSRTLSTLCAAIKKGDEPVVRLLVEMGQDVNEHDLTIPWGMSPLQCAAEEGNLGVIDYLLGKGANVNGPPAITRGATALQYAAQGGHLGIAHLLLQRGARINARGSKYQGFSALEAAAKQGKLDMLEFLICYGAVTSGPGRCRAVSAVRLAGLESHHAVVDWLKHRLSWSEDDEKLLNVIKKSHSRNRLRGKTCGTCGDVIDDVKAECWHDYSAEEEEL